MLGVNQLLARALQLGGVGGIICLSVSASSWHRTDIACGGGASGAGSVRLGTSFFVDVTSMMYSTGLVDEKATFCFLGRFMPNPR